MSRTSTRHRRVLERFLVVAALLTMGFPLRAMAEEFDPPGRVARVKYLQGRVSFQPAGEPDWVAAVVNRPTTTGDRFWTDAGARAELSIGSATARLDGTTGFSFLNLDDRTVQIELTQGTVDIRVLRLGRDETFEVDTPNQAFTILRPGQYRVGASEDGQATFVMVRSGEGEATGAGQTYTVRSGERGAFTGVDSLRAEIVDAGGADEFENWGRSRDRHDDASRSALYVSRDVVGYEDLDDYGSWRSDPSYGNVWVPTHVAAGWAPYREGHWAWISPWGWTWVDEQPWGYAPYHYGRWVNVRGSWGWVPGPIAVQPVYAPALVAFIGGPGFGISVSVGGGGYVGNVGWFPLGPREVYVPAYHVSPAYVNRVNVSNTTVSTTTITTVYNTQVTNNYSSTKITYVNRTVPGGVTAVPHGVFASAQPVARAAVAVDVQQVASAPVGARVAVAPTRDSVLGVHASTAGSGARPPPAIASRPVVVKVAPPPPAVPFSRQQEALAAHPGQPLAQQEVEKLRPADRAAVPVVKQAPPGKPATPEARRPGTQPGQPATAQPPREQPGAKPAAASRGQPAKPQPSSAPAGKPQETRANPPTSARPGEQPQPGVQPAAVSSGQLAKPQPSSAPPGRPQETRADRPPSAQPGTRPQPGVQPAAASPGQPARAEPPSVPPGKPQETHRDPPPSAQPGKQPQPGVQPAAASPRQPAKAQPSSAPSGKPQETRTDRPPSAQPSRQSALASGAPGRPAPQTDRPQQPGPQAAPGQNPQQTSAQKDREYR